MPSTERQWKQCLVKPAHPSPPVPICDGRPELFLPIDPVSRFTLVDDQAERICRLRSWLWAAIVVVAMEFAVIVCLFCFIADQ